MTTKTIVHVNRHKIAANRKHARLDPPIAVRKSKHASAEYANEVSILDSSGNVVATVKYAPNAPLKCGAVVFIECNYGVAVVANSIHQDKERPNVYGELCNEVGTGGVGRDCQSA